jgi:hypothetical protein
MTRLRRFGQATLVLRCFNSITAAVVTLFAAYLHVLFFLNAGGLWRNEAAFVHFVAAAVGFGSVAKPAI